MKKAMESRTTRGLTSAPMMSAEADSPRFSKRPSSMGKTLMAGLRWLSCLALVGLAACESKSQKNERELKADLEVLKGICRQYEAGDHIYRTVENVRGLFVANENLKPNPRWGDQFGLASPWAHHEQAGGGHLQLGQGDPKGGGYWFVEGMRAHGSTSESRFQRIALIRSDRRPNPAGPFSSYPPRLTKDGFYYSEKAFEVDSLLSEYVLTSEDLTTPEMRKHWITGGRVRLAERASGEVLAERIEFYRASGPAVLMAWVSGVYCQQLDEFKSAYVANNGALFVKYVLKPKKESPDDDQLNAIGRD